MKREILKDKTLALFFTAGVSLKTWHDIGMIDREVAVYNRLAKHFKQIYLFTYGGSEDLGLKHYLADNIKIIPSRCPSNILLYSFLLPLIHRKILKNVDILKTNQMLGSWSAMIAKILYRKKLVVRTGYMWSFSYAKEKPQSRVKISIIRILERLAYRVADAAVTSSQRNFDHVEQNYHPRNHIIIPNYVETDVFEPLKTDKIKRSICFVGRLSREKNLPALMEALAGLPYTIDIIGTGAQSVQLKEAAAHNRVSVNFMGNVPNHELPVILNRHELFVLPSLWEGMPKTLLEAMACGLPVIGTSVEGIKEVIKHGENGILCNTDSGSIREAIMTVMEDEGLRERLGKNARKAIEEGFSLEEMIERELEMYSRLAAGEKA